MHVKRFIIYFLLCPFLIPFSMLLSVLYPHVSRGHSSGTSALHCSLTSCLLSLRKLRPLKVRDLHLLMCHLDVSTDLLCIVIYYCVCVCVEEGKGTVDPVYEALRYGTSLAQMSRSTFNSISELPCQQVRSYCELFL